MVIYGLITLAAIELMARFYLKARARGSETPPQIFEKNLYETQKDSSYGYILKRGGKHNAIKSLPNGKEIYNVNYTVDGYGRRDVGQKENIDNPNLLMFGCSYAYGEGLNDRDTLQYMLADKGEYNVYNYAVHGYGPQHMLAILESNQIPPQVDCKNAIGLYVYQENHIERAVGSSRVPWVFSGPRYVNDDYGVSRKGTFNSSLPLSCVLFKLYSKLCRKVAFLKVLDFRIPWRIKQKHIDLTAEIIRQSQEVYKQKIKGVFYVVIHPLSLNHSLTRPMIDSLESKGIKILHYSVGQRDKYRIAHDGHPNVKLNNFLSAQLIRDLERDSQEKVAIH